MIEMRARLREATQASHERMHGHAGFAAAASGAISLADYRDLLARLWGFHAAFDADMRRAPDPLASEIRLPARARSGLLAEDLAGLGLSPAQIARLPVCQGMPALAGTGAFLGALYVVEGSTLGGAVIARALAPVAGEDRRFFLGHGREQGRLWRDFLARLERLDDDPPEADRAERAAGAVFDAFEAWMKEWRGACGREAEAQSA